MDAKTMAKSIASKVVAGLKGKLINVPKDQLGERSMVRIQWLKGKYKDKKDYIKMSEAKRLLAQDPNTLVLIE